MIVIKGENGMLFNPAIIKVVNVPFGGAKIMAKNNNGSVWSNEVTRESASKAIEDVGDAVGACDVDTDNWYLDLTSGRLKAKRFLDYEWKSSENNESDSNPKDTEESGN